MKWNKEGAKTAFGFALLITSIILSLSFISFFFHGQADQSQYTDVLNPQIEAQNIFGKIGAAIGQFFIYYSLGVAAFFIPFFLFIFAIKVLFNKEPIKIWKSLSHSLFFLVWLPVALGFLIGEKWNLSGLVGVNTADFLSTVMGSLGVGFLLLFALLLYFIFEFNLDREKLQKLTSANPLSLFSSTDSTGLDEEKDPTEDSIPKESQENTTVDSTITPSSQEKIIKEDPKVSTEIKTGNLEPKQEFSFEKPAPLPNRNKNNSTKEVEKVAFEVETAPKEITETEEKDVAQKIVDKSGTYDPRLDLPNYQFPSLDLLKVYKDDESITINQEELEANKNKIVETLSNYKIGIDKIKATIGPTVTLYEIVPEAGVRISKIKNLEDDIALSLAALGIRIIAPIPGKGTIGIEVPNSNATIVSMHSVINAQKFKNIKAELPIAFGKTISNETFVADLAKMPHMLMAGATGQGKSVGLNAVITSLLYKKHPNELKFVFVDPKKVELTLYNKIERHYLAKLPDTEEAIITDNDKVIHTLNSLCVEMDERYELLKNAMVRNIKEYNTKFINRKLNPENGHRFLPYIVLVVDEFADLIMTAGKEVEQPIARLAQLARAIGIHLIIATQRPSVNVITGIIKANFPARVAFRVTSKIDSRTILDGPGADQLIGKGDMLFTTGNEMIRLQCAFVDTPEVEEITDFIGSQKGPSEAYLLPEPQLEEGGGLGTDIGDDRDDLFEEAARVLVTAQQGSTSLIQRKLAIGYNRAGRIIDQLEAAGIVGPFEGSKARKVLYSDLHSLEQFLNSLNE